LPGIFKGDVPVHRLHRRPYDYVGSTALLHRRQITHVTTAVRICESPYTCIQNLFSEMSDNTVFTEHNKVCFPAELFYLKMNTKKPGSSPLL
jgi:hypothetical protein